MSLDDVKETFFKPDDDGEESSDYCEEKLLLEGHGYFANKKSDCSFKYFIRILLALCIALCSVIVVAGLVVSFLLIHTRVSKLQQNNESLQMTVLELKDEVQRLKEQWTTTNAEVVDEDAYNTSKPVNKYENWDKILDISKELSSLDALNSTQLALVQSIIDQSQKLESIEGQLTDLESGHKLIIAGMRKLELEVRRNNSLLNSSLNVTSMSLALSKSTTLF